MTLLLARLFDLFRDPGPGDFLFVTLWAICSLLLVAYYVYRMFQR